MTSIKEKQVEKILDKIIGNGDEALRIVTKLAFMNKEITPELLASLEMLKKQNEEDANELNKELELTLDASGNIVPIRYSVEEITPEIDIVDCGGNIVHRLPVGKT
jgi:hypothetical protein